MNKREFTIGLGAGLLIASTLSMAGYLSFMANLGDENVRANTQGTTLEQQYTQSEAPQSADNSENAEAPLAAANEPPQEPTKDVTKITPSSEPPEQKAELPPVEEPQEDKPVTSEQEDKPEEAQEEEPPKQEPASEEPKPVTTPAQPVQTPQPAQTQQPTQTSQPTQTQQPTQTSQPTQTQQPTQTSQPTQTQQPTQTSQPTQTQKPAETSQPAQPPPPAQTLPPQYQAPDETGVAAVTIAPEASNAEIAAELSKSGVVGNAEEFAQYLDKVGLYNIKPESGTYELEKGKSYDEIIEEMTKGN